MPRLSPLLVLVLGLLTAGALFTGGCGNKGDLYLPDRAERPK
jgi:predicted small lipoprotein YifL